MSDDSWPRLKKTRNRLKMVSKHRRGIAAELQHCSVADSCLKLNNHPSIYSIKQCSQRLGYARTNDECFDSYRNI